MNTERYLPSILMIIAALTAANQARAVDATVGPGQCNEAGFSSVLDTVDSSGGGTITFNCGSAPFTIGFTSYKTIASAVTIDGANRIIFDGGGSSAFFQIFSSANVILKRLTFQHGAFNAAHPLENFGVLVLDSVRVMDNASGDSAIVNLNHLTIRSSTLSGNSISGDVIASGAALFSDGTTIIEQSIFSNNSIDSGARGLGGAIAVNSGTLDVSDTTFLANMAYDGGAIHIGGSSTQSNLTDCTFSANVGGNGGAIQTEGVNVSVVRGVFNNNQTVTEGGGAIWLYGDTNRTLLIEQSQFNGNEAGTNGGAIGCIGGNLQVNRSAFGANHAGSNGGGIYSTCRLAAVNVTFHGNTASIGGGAIYRNSVLSGAQATIVFATINGNSATFGGGLYSEFSSMGMTAVGRSIVSENIGGNCDGALLSLDYNLSNDNSCGGVFIAPDDILNTSLPLQPFGDYGGPTFTQPPLPGNPAIDHAPVAFCLPNEIEHVGRPLPTGSTIVDQRGAMRPVGPGCDSGSVEVGGIFDRIFAGGFDIEIATAP